MDSNVIEQLIAGVFSIITAVITGIFTVEAVKAGQRKKGKKRTQKIRWLQILAGVLVASVMGVIVFYIITPATKVVVRWLRPSDLPGLEFANPDYYVEENGQDFGYEILNLTALQYYPTSNVEPSAALTADQTAQNYAAHGNYEQAIAKHIEATDLQPDNALFRYHKGVTLAHMGDYETASEELKKCIELEPESVKLNLQKGNNKA